MGSLSLWSSLATNTASPASPSEAPCRLFPVATISAALWPRTSKLEFSSGGGVVGGAESGLVHHRCPTEAQEHPFRGGGEEGEGEGKNLGLSDAQPSHLA